MQLFLVVQNTDEESDQDATFTNYKTLLIIKLKWLKLKLPLISVTSEYRMKYTIFFPKIPIYMEIRCLLNQHSS